MSWMQPRTGAIAVAAALVVWWIVAVGIANHAAGKRIADLVTREAAIQAQTAEGTVFNIDVGFRQLRGVAMTVASDPAVSAVLASFGADVAPSALPVAERRSQ